MGSDSEGAKLFSFLTSLANAGETPNTINLCHDPEGSDGSVKENR
jgi:hypothetical protein